MTASTIHLYITNGGILGAIALGLRIAYQIGQLITRLDTHIKQVDKTFEDVKSRVTWLEQRRR